jgi:hypothetical protein
MNGSIVGIVECALWQGLGASRQNHGELEIVEFGLLNYALLVYENVRRRIAKRILLGLVVHATFLA